MFLGGCAAKVEDYAGTQPVMEFDKFFNGPVKGWGIVQDRNGKVIKQFDISMVGTWEGDQGTLAEDFTYYDGKKWKRAWHIKKLGPNKFVGSADDVIGDAPGKSVGTAVNWDYVMKVPVGDTTYDIRFDDWMFMMHDDVVINRSYMKKFGIKVGELTIFMQKQK